MEYGIEASDGLNFMGVSDFEIKVEKPTVRNILPTLGSGLSLDIAKNHSGVCMYKDGKITQVGFELNKYDNSDYHGDYRMRLDLKNRLKELVGGMQFDYVIVEDVYGGENYDTVRKLLVLQTVIDELIFEGTIECKHFYRWLKTKWFKYFKEYYPARKYLKSKIATQEILEYLEDSFYLSNNNISDREKEKIYFEDICDATAMLCGLALYISKTDTEDDKERKITMKDIKMYYIENEDDYLSLSDNRIRCEGWYAVDSDYTNLEQKVIDSAKEYPEIVLRMDVPVTKLGRFGVENKLTFYPSGDGVLLWYLKQK